MGSLKLIHYFTFFSRLGGVESVLRRHWSNDRNFGIESQIVAFFDRANSMPERVVGLDLSWRDCIASARSKFSRLISSLDSRSVMAIYHNAWGLPFLADLDRAPRRCSVIHSDFPTLGQVCRSQQNLVDGVLCVNEPLQAQVKQYLPALGPERFGVLPYPIAHPPETSRRVPLNDRPIVCGYAGRIIKEQKRVDRLPLLCRAMDRADVRYRFEILGDGPDRPWLERQMANPTRFRFHGRQEGEAYWRILQGWDVIVFVSDYEGLPISLLEALSVGVIPIYPRIQSGGDAYTGKVRGDLVYGSGDFDQVAGVIKALQGLSEPALTSLRESAQRLAAPHQGDAYERVFSEFVHRINEAPRVSSTAIPPRPLYWTDYVPFAALRKFYYRGFFRRNDGLPIGPPGL